MQATEQLKRRIEGAGELLQVVRTMKAIALVAVHEFELAEEALRRYSAVIDQGLAATLPRAQQLPEQPAPCESDPLGVIAIGSDHGLCGAFNKTVASRVMALTQRERPTRVAVLGTRLAGLLTDSLPAIDAELKMPKTVQTVSAVAGEVLVVLAHWESIGVREVVIVGERRLSGTEHGANDARLLPLDLADLATRCRWPARAFPGLLGRPVEIATELLEQHVRAELAAALAASLVAENEARVATTQGAEHNIRERLDGLKAEYRRAYQGAETEELLDVVSGFESITRGDARAK
jgi:F-type H+-transporting ATPase subunit gamma